MFAVLVLSLLAAAASAERAPHDPGYQNGGPSFEEVMDLLNVVELEKFGLFEELSSITTLCAVVDEKITSLKSDFNPVVSTRREQQDGVVKRLSDQIKSMRHRLDAADAKMTEVAAITRDTGFVVQEQINDYLDGPKLEGEQEAQQGVIDDLRLDLADFKGDILDDLAAVLTNVVSVTDEGLNATEQLIKDIDARQCEHGTGTFAPGEYDVLFKTNFTVTPVVTLQVVGFTSHLGVDSYDGHGFPKVDALGLDKYVDYVNERGFGVHVEEKTEGSVALKTVSCSWAACQNLNVKIQS